MLSMTEADNGRTVELRAGDTIRLSLPENAGGGYRWDIDRVEDELVTASGPHLHYPSGAVGSAALSGWISRQRKPGAAKSP